MEYDQRNKRNEGELHYTADIATERDPLIHSPQPAYSGTSNIRERRPRTRTSVSPTTSTHSSINSSSQYEGEKTTMDNSRRSQQKERKNSSFTELPAPGRVPPPYDGPDTSYEICNENDNINKPVRSIRSLRSIRSAKSQRDSRFSRTFSDGRYGSAGGDGTERGSERGSGRGDQMHQYYNERANRIFSEQPSNEEPLFEVSEQIMSVRRSALKVYEPLTYTWLIFSPGFTSALALGTAKMTGLLDNVTYWFILLPCWLSHLTLFASHIYAVKALSTFIANANKNRMRPDSTDHIDRTEYLPLLQRSLKFGIKTGAVSLALFIFEILLYFRLSNGRLSLASVLTPLWLIVIGGILDGIVCKTQHFTRVLSWVLMFSFMILLVLKVDVDIYNLSWNVVFTPLFALQIMSIGVLLYILRGHSIGYFRLTASQVTAGVLYLAASISSVVLVIIIYMQDLVRPTSFHVMVAMVALTPLIVALLSLGAYAVSRDEFERLLQYGGQAAVHPMKLRLENEGWTAVESKGVFLIPMFGEVKYQPLDPQMKSNYIELCFCCSCYAYEDEEEGAYIAEHGKTFAEGSQRRLT